jgi:site-specific recombinase XerD
MDSTGRSLVPLQSLHSLKGGTPLPALIRQAGTPAGFAWDEFFSGFIRNHHTRTAYRRAVCRFLDWTAGRTDSLATIAPGLVGEYLDRLPGSPPTRKLHLAALRAFFDLLVTRHVVVLNPAASVRGERYQVVEGKTPEITAEQVKQLVASIKLTGRAPGSRERAAGPDDRPPVPRVVGLRDRAVICTLVYTAARAGAVAGLRVGDLTHDGVQYLLRFTEKGGKSREIPVRHDLERYLTEYREAAGLKDTPRDGPLFRSADRRTGRLTDKPLTGQDVCRLVKRRLKDAGLPLRLSPHSFRVATVTDLLSQGVPLEDVQYLAGHSDPRTTRLYDRRQKRVTRNLVERISI